MHIGGIGAAGTIGSRIVTEALGRGHQVAAFSRNNHTPNRIGESCLQ